MSRISRLINALVFPTKKKDYDSKVCVEYLLEFRRRLSLLYFELDYDVPFDLNFYFKYVIFTPENQENLSRLTLASNATNISLGSAILLNLGIRWELTNDQFELDRSKIYTRLYDPIVELWDLGGVVQKDKKIFNIGRYGMELKLDDRKEPYVFC